MEEALAGQHLEVNQSFHHQYHHCYHQHHQHHHHHHQHHLCESWWEEGEVVVTKVEGGEGGQRQPGQASSS